MSSLPKRNYIMNNKINNKILVFHGLNSSIKNKRYDLPFEVIGKDINYENTPFYIIRDEMDKIILKELNNKSNLILLGHSFGAWWARYFAKKYNISALLLNPFLAVDKPNYLENFFPFDSYPPCPLYYYIELGDEQIDFKKYLNLFEKEGNVFTINGGHHRISYPNNILRILNEIINNEII